MTPPAMVRTALTKLCFRATFISDAVQLYSASLAAQRAYHLGISRAIIDIEATHGACYVKCDSDLIALRGQPVLGVLSQRIFLSLTEKFMTNGVKWVNE